MFSKLYLTNAFDDTINCLKYIKLVNVYTYICTVISLMRMLMLALIEGKTINTV